MYHLEEEQPSQIDLKVWRRLLGYARQRRFLLTGFLTLALITALIEVSFPLLTKAVIDDLTAGRPLRWPFYAALYGAMLVTMSAAIWGFIRLGGAIRTCISHDIRRDAFANLQRLSFDFYDRRPAGWLVARMTADCDRLSEILTWGLLDLVWGSAVMVGIATAMLWLEPRLALMTLAVLPLLVWASRHFQLRLLHSARRTRRANSQLTAAYSEAVMGMRTSKAFARERANSAEFGRLTQEMYHASIVNALQAALYLPVVLTLGSIATGIALAAGGYGVLAGGITLGTLIAFMSYTRQFFDPIEEMAGWFAELQTAQAAAERVIALIDERPTIQDSPAVAARLRQPPLPGATTDGLEAQIERIDLCQVGFAYEPNHPILKGVDLSVRRGETIALVGPTGGGKSTLVNLIARFYEPTEGQILINGRDYRERGLQWYHSQLGMVLQSSHIFSGTIADNLRYGRLDATPAQIQEACRQVGADAFIAALPAGYQTLVGEEGVRLSAGQRQLLAIARAILADPQLLILDEATATVDAATEQHIQQGLEQLLQGRISFIIAHRLATIRHAHRILFIRNAIIEAGSHEELLAQRGEYFALYLHQRWRGERHDATTA